MPSLEVIFEWSSKAKSQQCTKKFDMNTYRVSKAWYLLCQDANSGIHGKSDILVAPCTMHGILRQLSCFSMDKVGAHLWLWHSRPGPCLPESQTAPHTPASAQTSTPRTGRVHTCHTPARQPCNCSAFQEHPLLLSCFWSVQEVIFRGPAVRMLAHSAHHFDLIDR